MKTYDYNYFAHFDTVIHCMLYVICCITDDIDVPYVFSERASEEQRECQCVKMCKITCTEWCIGAANGQ